MLNNLQWWVQLRSHNDRTSAMSHTERRYICISHIVYKYNISILIKYTKIKRFKEFRFNPATNTRTHPCEYEGTLRYEYFPPRYYLRLKVRLVFSRHARLIKFQRIALQNQFAFNIHRRNKTAYCTKMEQSVCTLYYSRIIYWRQVK